MKLPPSNFLSGSKRSHRPIPIGDYVLGLSLILLVALIVLLFFLSIFQDEGKPTPIDTDPSLTPRGGF